MDFLALLKKKSSLKPLQATLEEFYASYKKALEANNHSIEKYETLLETFLEAVDAQLQRPTTFSAYHLALRAPIDYYQMGLDFIRPLVMKEGSKKIGWDHLNDIATSLEQGDNVILLSNHQTEVDPQAISLLLEESFPKLAEEMIFVAGHRVVTDPLAVPFSLGRHLICIYSKRYLLNPPQERAAKIAHNSLAMRSVVELLKKGGCCFYVAPSGGRDRPNEKGIVEVSPFDAESLEMFFLLARQARRATHFYPLSLATYALLPPPDHIVEELGERRLPKAAPLFMAFGKEIDVVALSSLSREEKARIITEYVRALYVLLLKTEVF